MSGLDNICDQLRSMQSALIDGFAAMERALQPTIEVFRVFALRCKANRRARRASEKGNVAQWHWYTSEHLRRYSESINSESR